MIKWTIFYTDHKNEFIHYESLQKSNPTAEIILVDISNNYSKDDAWQNSDIFIREYLKNNVTLLNKNHNIALLEWDVFINTPLPDYKISGIFCKDVYTPQSEPYWYHWRDKKYLGKYVEYALGMVPFGVLFMDFDVIQTWIDQEFDELYQHHMQNELRLGSLLNSRNIKISALDMPKVCWKTTWTDFSSPSIYHPVKHKVSTV